MVRVRRIAVSSSDIITKGLRRLPTGGRLFGPLLGLVFLIYPIRTVLASDPTSARVLCALGGAVLFVGIFLWLMWMHEPLPSAVAEPFEVRKRRAAIAFLAVLAVALNLALGSEWRVLFFHLNVAAGVMLLTRDAYAAIAGLAVLTLALGITSGMAWLVLPTVAIGLWATAFVRQVAAVAELRAAREEIARLAVAEERLRFARDLHDLIRHSHAGYCEIRITREGEEVRAEISDDGRGSSPESNGVATGSGLSGLAERVETSGGDFEAMPLPRGGFRLRVSLPLRDETNPDTSRAGGTSEDGW